MTAPFRIRVEIYANDSSYGPGTLRAAIDDPKDVGVSSYANDVGEFYMTLPWNHPAISECDPYESHYKVKRYNPVLNPAAIQTIAAGYLDDFDASRDEVVVYGSDYMGLLSLSASASSTSYTATALGTIVTSQLTQAMAEANTRLAFTSVGTIEATSKTATLITNYQERLQFLRGVADVSMADRSVRTILSIGRTPNSAGLWRWNFVENQGSDMRDVRLEFPKAVNDFRFSPGFRDFATHVQAVGVKTEGAQVLYSTQSYASPATYGRIMRTALFQDVSDQTALDDRTKRSARRYGRTKKYWTPVVKQGVIAPWTGWELGDSVPTICRRGSSVVIDDLRTIWGMEWTMGRDGTESLFFDLQPKDI